MPGTESGPRPPTRILLVEDNPGDARLLEEYLREAPLLDATMERVDRLEAARERLRGDLPDVVLLDLSLPDAHGMETVRQALECAPNVPIIVLTGLDDEGVALQAVQSGAQDYLIKGQVDPVLLARSIRYAIERKQVDRERQRLLAQEREARGRAEAAVRARDQVLQVLSHDLGSPLSAIQIYSGMLMRALPESGAGAGPHEWARGIKELALDLQQLREDMLDAAHIEAGRLSLEPRTVEPQELLESARERFLPLAMEKSIEVELACAPELPEIRADRQRMLQVLGNLLGNAIKFTPAGGSIALRAEPEGLGVRFSVSDTGPGVAPEDQPHVFESFWKRREGNPQGAGLGLSIARGIVEMHGGRIQVESEPGVGSVFSLTLPGVATARAKTKADGEGSGLSPAPQPPQADALFRR